MTGFLTRATLFTVLLALHSHAESVEVHIDSHHDEEYNCTLTTNSTGPIWCFDLPTALTNCTSNLTANLTFILREFQVLHESLSYVVSNFVHIQGSKDCIREPSDVCLIYGATNSIEFVFDDQDSDNNKKSQLFLSNFAFLRCGNGQDKPGIQITGMTNVIISNVVFSSVLGVSILNVLDVNIESSKFEHSYINPYAVLQITYDNSASINETTNNVAIQNCLFSSNQELENYFSSEGISGIFVVYISELIKESFSITVRDCTFENNDLSYYSYRSPMLVVSNVSDASIQFFVEDCIFTNNRGLAVMITISPYFDNKDFFIRFFNNLFVTNDNPFSSYGLVHVSINNVTSNGFITVNYEQLNFTKNSGILLVSKSDSSVNHDVNSCCFVDNSIENGMTYQIAFLSSSQNEMPNIHLTYVTLNELTYNASTHSINNIKYGSVFIFKSVHLDATNLKLVGSDNVTATMFMLNTSDILFNGNNIFYNNQGKHGGGLIMNGSNLTITEGSTLTFNNNNADYGGAMYINTTDFNNALRCHGRINFINNHAHIAGPSIYTTDSNVSVDKLKNCFNNPQNEIATAPKIFNTAIASSNRPFFPGQFLMLNVFLVDGLNNPGSCKAEITLECNKTDTGEHGLCEQLYPNVSLQLVGPFDTFLFGTNGVVNTLLPFFQVHFNVSLTQTNATLHVACVDPPLPSMKVNFIWTSSCPLGFIKNDTTIKTYRCTCNATENDIIHCPPESSVVCIKTGYWVNGTTFATIKCPYPFCNFSYSQDTIDASICQQYYGQHVVALPQYESDQCSTHHAGTACLQCQKDYYLTFLGTKCTEDCQNPLHPILISLFTVTFQFLIALFILVAVRTKLEIGAGFVYGPLIFIAIIGQMPLGYIPQYRALKIIVSFVTSVYLVNLEIFGEIPWCFGIPDSKLLLIKSFYYLGPALVWLILLLLVVVGRKCPRLLSKLQDSPVQAICLLMMLSFWSMTDTSIHMLKPLQIEDTWYCNEDPNVKYFHDEHIAVGLIAIAILTFAIVPFVALLAMSNFEIFNRIFRLYRFKPIFDEFQSCYVDKHRWYCVVYFISFIIYLVVTLVENTLGPPLLLLLLLSLHFIIQPYKKHILNIIDMLLLLDLLVLYFVLERHIELLESDTFSTVLVHMLTLIPLLYIVVGSVGVLSLQCIRKIKAKCSSYSFGNMRMKNKKKIITKTKVIFDNSEGEREPLIRIIQTDNN